MEDTQGEVEGRSETTCPREGDKRRTRSESDAPRVGKDNVILGEPGRGGEREKAEILSEASRRKHTGKGAQTRGAEEVGCGDV